MTNEKLLEAIGGINDNEIRDAKFPRRSVTHRWIKWVAAAACLSLILCAIPIMNYFITTPGGQGGNNPIPGGNNSIQHGGIPNDNPEQTQSAITSQIHVNHVDELTQVDMDVQYESFGDLPDDSWQNILTIFNEYVGIAYNEFTAKIPKAFTLDSFYSILSRGYTDGTSENEYCLHDYVFDYRMEGGGKVIIALCAFEKPLRDCFFSIENPKLSEVNGAALTVYEYENNYYVQFSYNNVYYDIQTQNITLEGLEALLVGIMA